MELQYFVAETLRQIINGVRDAQETTRDTGGRINPTYEAQVYNQHTQDVEFDVAVTATEGKESKGGIGIFAVGIGIGTQGKTDSASSSMSRIRFSVPVDLPEHPLGD